METGSILICNKTLPCSRGKKYSSYPSLQRHTKTHDPPRPRPTPSHPCPQCGKTFSCISHLKKHLGRHDPNRIKNFACAVDKCGKTFCTKYDLQSHSLAHSNLKEFECNFCKATFKRKQGLNCHVVAIHTLERAYKCSQCGESFSNSGSLKSHASTHTDARPFPCPQCEKSFKRSDSLKNHVTNFHSPSTQSCSLCGKSYISRINLARHMRTHQTPSFLCYFCKRTFPYRPDLERHMATHTEEKPYPCPVDHCLYAASTRHCLLLHQKHNHAIPGTSPPRRWPCYFCPKSYPGSHTLAKHMRNHTSEKPYNCPLCEKSFIDPSYVRRHIATHTKETPFKCTEAGCEARFVTFSARVTHLAAIHRRVKRFFCDLCPYSSYYKSSITAHGLHQHPASTHSCPVCSKSFNCRKNLDRHSRSHLRRRYLCYFCQREFSDPPCLQYHMNTHINQKPFFCPKEFCPYSAAHPSALQSHRQHHHPTPGAAPPKMWTCYFCPKGFPKFSILARHMSSHIREKIHQCPFPGCSAKFSAASWLRRHIHGSPHRKELPFACLETGCGQRFLTQGKRETHIAKIHRREKRFFCHLCNFSSFYKKCFVNHGINLHRG